MTNPFPATALAVLLVLGLLLLLGTGQSFTPEIIMSPENIAVAHREFSNESSSGVEFTISCLSMNATPMWELVLNTSTRLELIIEHESSNSSAFQEAASTIQAALSKLSLGALYSQTALEDITSDFLSSQLSSLTFSLTSSSIHRSESSASDVSFYAPLCDNTQKTSCILPGYIHSAKFVAFSEENEILSSNAAIVGPIKQPNISVRSLMPCTVSNDSFAVSWTKPPVLRDLTNSLYGYEMYLRVAEEGNARQNSSLAVSSLSADFDYIKAFPLRIKLSAQDDGGYFFGDSLNRTNFTFSGCYPYINDSSPTKSPGTHCISPWTVYYVSLRTISSKFLSDTFCLVTTKIGLPKYPLEVIAIALTVNSAPVRFFALNPLTGPLVAIKLDHVSQYGKRTSMFIKNSPVLFDLIAPIPGVDPDRGVFLVRISNLSPYTFYEANITWYTEAGPGAVNNVSFTTLPSSPTVTIPPSMYLYGSRVFVNWTAPFPPAGPIVYYELISRDPFNSNASSTSSSLVVYHGTENFAILNISDLGPFGMNHIRLVAATAVGASSPSEPATNFMKSGQISNLTLVELQDPAKSDHLVLSWKQPEYSLIGIHCYQVFLVSTSRQEQNIFNVSKNFTSFEFSNSDALISIRDSVYVRVLFSNGEMGPSSDYANDHRIKIVLQPSSSSSSSSTVIIAALCAVFSVIVIALAVGFLFYFRKHEPENNFVFPADDGWEITRNCFEKSRAIGQGEFGIVSIARTKIEIREVPAGTFVAMKLTKESKYTHESLALIEEANIMKKVSEPFHPNVVRLLGVCMQSFPLTIVMEYALYGDLRSFLLNRPESAKVSNFWKYRFCHDVSQAMRFLASKHFVHRDLACRNCLVFEDFSIKVGDFGMSKDVEFSEYYRKEGETVLPVRWIAPECLVEGRFSSDGDVWSMGIVFWEIFSNGRLPYPSWNNQEVLQNVLKGYRLPQPETCPDEVFQLILRCWSASRPQNLELCSFFNEKITPYDLLEDLSIHSKPPDLGENELLSLRRVPGSPGSRETHVPLISTSSSELPPKTKGSHDGKPGSLAPFRSVDSPSFLRKSSVFESPTGSVLMLDSPMKSESPYAKIPRNLASSDPPCTPPREATLFSSQCRQSTEDKKYCAETDHIRVSVSRLPHASDLESNDLEVGYLEQRNSTKSTFV